MLIEPGVFNGQHRVNHGFRNVFERCQAAALFTEFPDQQAIRGKHA